MHASQYSRSCRSICDLDSAEQSLEGKSGEITENAKIIELVSPRARKPSKLNKGCIHNIPHLCLSSEMIYSGSSSGRFLISAEKENSLTRAIIQK